jgi:Holliday junction resolvasome RuvABC endonuclease subunit
MIQSDLIMGFDPGVTQHGWAVLRDTPSGPVYVDSGHEQGEADAVMKRLLAGYRLRCVAIETPTMAFLPQAIKPVMAMCRQAGLALAMVRHHRPLPHIHEASANVWRRNQLGNGSAKNAAIKTLVTSTVQGWPTRSNDHERDAAGVALDALAKLHTQTEPTPIATRRAPLRAAA